MTFLSDKQLFWLEELPNSFVEVYNLPQGQPFVEEITGKVVRTKDLDLYIKSHPLENLWRSWAIYEDVSKSKLIGCLPAVVDIDDESDNSSISFPPQTTPNLQKSYELTRICSNIIIEKWAKSESRIRVVFSGHKGFHIEFKPIKSVDMILIRKELIGMCVRNGLTPSPNANNTFFETVSIDNIHNELRLTGSTNSWQTSEGHIHSRRVIQLTLNEFLTLKLDGVLLKSELHSDEI